MVSTISDSLGLAWLNSEITVGGIPLLKVSLAIAIVTLAQIFRKLFSAIIIQYLETVTSQTTTELDDELIAILKQPLNWLIVIAGLWLAKLSLVTEIPAKINEVGDNLINLVAIAAIAWIIFRASPLLGQVLSNLALNTETELDDLIVPYLPKLFQALAIAIVLLKAGEVLLGASAGALIGLVGGTGITLGLLLKDIIYDWFCTLIIFSDRLYRIGDILKVQGINNLAQVTNIGIRSTTLCIMSQNTLTKIPNSKMITGIIENWSQNPEPENLLGIDITLKIDDISASQTARICQALNQFPQTINDLSDRFTAWFSGIEGNARIIKIQTFAKTDNIKSYRRIWHEVNLNILQVMEQEKIALFSSTPIAILPSTEVTEQAIALGEEQN